MKLIEKGKARPVTNTNEDHTKRADGTRYTAAGGRERKRSATSTRTQRR